MPTAIATRPSTTHATNSTHRSSRRVPTATTTTTHTHPNLPTPRLINSLMTNTTRKRKGRVTHPTSRHSAKGWHDVGMKVGTGNSWRSAGGLDQKCATQIQIQIPILILIQGSSNLMTTPRIIETLNQEQTIQRRKELTHARA